MAGHFLKPSSGSEVIPVHSILYIIAVPVEKVKNSYDRNSIKTLERVYKHYYFIIRGEVIQAQPWVFLTAALFAFLTNLQQETCPNDGRVFAC